MTRKFKSSTAYVFEFKFDEDCIGTKRYVGTLNQCYKKFKSDCRKQVLPNVTSTISIKPLQLY